VAFYVGGSETGKRAGFSHTGALAGPDKLYDGLFQQSGVIRASSINELYDFCWVLGSCPLPEGNRVIIQTQSGGPGAAAADACGRAGLDLPTFSPQTLEKLAPFVPHTGSVNNPVDLTFTKDPLEYFDGIPQVLLDEPNADLLMIYILTPESAVIRALEAMAVSKDQIPKLVESHFDDQAEALSALKKKYARPIVGFSFHNREHPMLKKLRAFAIPILPSPNRAAKAMAALVKYSRFKKILKDDIIAANS
jgi:acyl-CoA synthetase (NDP forming)